MAKRRRKRTAARRSLDRSKAHERRVARWFGTERTPLSGGASRHTRSDTLHPKLYIEVKGAAGPGGTNGWLWRWLDKLMPWQGVVVTGGSGLHVFSPQGIDVWLSAYPIDVPAAAWALWHDTQEKACKEGKEPVLALVLKGQRGFWLATTCTENVWDARLEALSGEEEG
jgi:hypothetical protein